MKVKKVVTLSVIGILLIGVLALIFTTTSMSSENGLISFDDEHTAPYVITSNSERSKKIDFEITVKGDENTTGSVVVEFIDNDGTVKLKEEILPGKGLKESIYFSRGGNEKIVITPKGFVGQIGFRKSVVCFF